MEWGGMVALCCICNLTGPGMERKAQSGQRRGEGINSRESGRVRELQCEGTGRSVFEGFK